MVVMSQQVLDYRSPLAKRPSANRPVYVAAGIAAAVALIVNAVLVSWAASDRSWGALGIMIMIGPITNGVLAFLSLPFIPLVRRVSGGASVVPYVLAGVLIPVGAVIVDAACILSMDLHGC
jgi:hypothetical protein